MAILQKVAFYPQERLDVPDARALEAYSQNDWSYFLKGILSANSQVVTGFDVTNWSDIFREGGVKLQQNNVSLIHPEAATQAMGFYVSAGSEADAELILNPDTVNYVEVDFSAEGGGRDVRAFYDPAANSGQGGEYTDTVDTVINLALNISVNVSGFNSGRIPLYKIKTDSTNKVIEITDCRSLLFRLGTGGASPDPNASFSFRSIPDLAHSRFETAGTATSAANNNQVFQGGDKNIRSLKEWMDVVMTQIKRGMNLPYWYAKPGATLAETYQNSALAFLTGGSWQHLGRSSLVTAVSSNTITVQQKNDADAAKTSFTPSPSSVVIDGITYSYTLYNKDAGLFSGVTPNPATGGVTVGAIVSQGRFGHLSLIGGSNLIRLGHSNCTLTGFSEISLTTNRVLFTILPTDGDSCAYTLGSGSLPIVPKTIVAKTPSVTPITSTSIKVMMGGNYVTAGGAIMVRGQKFFYTSYSASTGEFSGVSPDPSGFLSSGDLVYQITDAAGVNGYYHTSVSSDVPGISDGMSEGAERVFWLAYFDGDDTIIIRDSELVAGERVEVGNDTADQIYRYMGSTGAADSFPVYRVKTIADGTDLTSAIKRVYNILETPIYDEIINDASGNGWAANTIITIPVNSRANGATAQFTVGSGELEVYDNGVLLRGGPPNSNAGTYDYVENNSTSIKLLRPVYSGSYLRFRVSSVGGAGAAAGGGTAGADLQAVYSNGNTIITQSGIPVVIEGNFSEKLLHIKGGLQVDGLIDPTGLELTKQSSNPISAQKLGIWIHNDGKLKYTKEDGSVIDIGGVVELLGGESQYFSRTKVNGSSATIPAGAPVYIRNDGRIALADADDENASTFFGIAAHSISPNASGKVIYTGTVPGILSGLGLPNGSYLWLSATPGGMAQLPPDTSGAFLRVVGIVDGDDLILQQQVSGRVG